MYNLIFSQLLFLYQHQKACTHALTLLKNNDLARDEYLKLAGASLADELRKDKVCFQLAMCYYRLEDRNCANQWWQTILSEVPNTPLRKQIEFWLGK